MGWGSEAVEFMADIIPEVRLLYPSKTLELAVFLHLDAIDQRIADAIDNYSPERLDRVDRAILRLGGYEILFAEDVPVAVAINEAIKLARSFGTTESPGFINGVLDRVAQNA